MYGTLTFKDTGMVFEVWSTFDEAIINAEIEKQNKHKVTIFSYDEPTKEYREYYALPVSVQ